MASLALALLLVVPAAGILAVLLAWGAPRAQAALAFGVSLLDLAVVGWLWRLGAGAGSHAAGGWPAPYGIVLEADGLSRLMLALTALVFTAATAYHLGQAARDAEAPRSPALNLAWPLLLLALNGLFVTTDYFNFYVFFELVAVSSYLVVCMGRHDALEAAWKYATQSVVGSLFLLVGVALLYGATGTLAMADAASRLPAPAWWLAPFFLTAFLLKAAVFPFHWWQPDAHAAAPTAGSMVLAGVLIKVGLYGILRFWPLLAAPGLGVLLLGLGGASIVFGAAAAWRQDDAKRLLGFSSVSQLGFVLVGIGWGTPGALAAALFFLVGHSLAKVLLFAATGLLADRAGSTRITALAPYGPGARGLGAAYLVGVCSLVGLPPTVGFAGKVALVVEGARAAAWPWLGLVAAGSVMTLGYGFRAYQGLFWAPMSEAAPAGASAKTGAAVVACLTAGVVVAALAAGPLWRTCLATASELDARPLAGQQGQRPEAGPGLGPGPAGRAP